MFNFYLTIILTVAAVIVFMLFSAIKDGVRRQRVKKMAARSWQKLYSDEEKFICSRFRSLLPELTSGEIQWIIFQSQLKPFARFEITISVLSKLITIIYTGRQLSELEQRDIRSLGAEKYEKNETNSIILCGTNSKIICDIIFYLMDNIFGIKYIKKIKLIVSGGV